MFLFSNEIMSAKWYIVLGANFYLRQIGVKSFYTLISLKIFKNIKPGGQKDEAEAQKLPSPFDLVLPSSVHPVTKSYYAFQQNKRAVWGREGWGEGAGAE